jgi:hypothetical protein
VGPRISLVGLDAVEKKSILHYRELNPAHRYTGNTYGLRTRLQDQFLDDVFWNRLYKTESRSFQEETLQEERFP